MQQISEAMIKLADKQNQSRPARYVSDAPLHAKCVRQWRKSNLKIMLSLLSNRQV